MGRNKVLNGSVARIGQDLSNAAHAVIKVMSIPFHPSQTGEEHPPGPLETAVEVSYGSPVANSVTSETADYASQAEKLPLETATPAEEFSEAQVRAVVDAGLIDQPTPRRTNPTTVILPEINMEYAFEYEGTVLYEKQRGQWVAEPLPEKTAERVV